MNTKIIGNEGENRASDYLLSKGYAIIERNWRTKGGEIDIIADKNDTLVFCRGKNASTRHFRYDSERVK